MKLTENEVLQYVAENDVKFVKLTFFDVLGRMKNISVVASELPRVFESGTLFDASSIQGFTTVDESDLLLFPDPSTLSVLPWRPQQGRVVRFYCDVRKPDKSLFECDGRAFLKQAVSAAEKMGYTVQIGSECEFYLFNCDENGKPTKNPQDNAGYGDVFPLDRGENVRREICLTLEEMGIHPETSHHESGKGQNEIDFKYSNALDAADNLQTFKNVVKSIAHGYGLFASFMPLPVSDDFGSGLHINFSLVKDGKNIFKSPSEGHCQEAESFIAGILSRIKEITLFLNPLTNSYERFGKGEAPKYISWSHENRSQLIRIPAANGDLARMELRSPDPACNPYIAFALLIYAGIEGIQNGLSLPKPTNFDLYSTDKSVLETLTALPESLDEAIKLAENSRFINSIPDNRILKAFMREKSAELAELNACSDRITAEDEKYFKYY